MISIKNLKFSYKKDPFINNLSAKFEKGKLYCITGPNGSGKSTLINLISGGLSPKNGEILLEGSPLYGYSPKKLAEKLSLLPQRKILPEITVKQLVLYGRYPYMGLTKKPTETDIAAVEWAMERAGVIHLKERDLKTLSGGEVQSAYIAMLLSQNTDYLLLDEPTASLDVSGSLALMELLKELAAAEKCVIAVLHDLPTALHFADEVAVMQRGNIVYRGTPDETVKSDVIKEVFGVRVVAAEVEGHKKYVIF